ncbi:MAG: outer membrane beta-barrel protein [Candidatus Aminicenantales bacterium]
MKKFLVVLSLMLLAVTLTAQVRTGNVYGKITDTEGNPLPGVSVTLKGGQMAPLTTVTGETGIFRFPALGPGSDYELSAELTGFKKESKTGIIVTLGSNVEINLALTVGTLEEQVTVIAQTPVVDVKKTTVGQNVNKEMMQSLPTARDPWVVMQLAPSIMVDRENVGGNESGQQSGFVAKGDATGGMGRNQGANNLWTVDGVDITDPAALGGSAGYYDFDMFEELNVTTGGAADVSVQTGGIALNMVTRRGGNRMSLAGRFYLTDNFFQSENLTADLRAQGVARTNKIQQIKDFGFNAGGPILKDKLWWWGSYGVQDIFVYTITGNQDKTLLNNYNFKLNAQIMANNRFEALISSGAKEKFGRNSSLAKPEGDHQTGKYHWGSPVIKLQDEHVFGNNLYLSLKYSFNDAGFGWRPMTDEGVIYPIVYDQTTQKYTPYASGLNSSWGSYGVARPRNNFQMNANYFNDTFLNMSHEIKIGAEYSHKEQTYHTGNLQGFDINRNYSSLQLDVNADGTRLASEMAGWQRVALYRSNEGADLVDQYAGYIQDTISKNNFTLLLGLRWDAQVPGAGAYTRSTVYKGQTAWDTVFAPTTSDTLAAILPGSQVNAVKGEDQIVNGAAHAYSWSTWSPRLGLTWDITGDGKTVAKMALSQYGDVMGVGWWAAAPQGTGGGLRYWWNDANADRQMDLTEMFWAYSSRNPVGDPANPGLPYRYVPYNVFNADGSLTTIANAQLVGGYDSDAYVSGGYYSFDYFDPTNVVYGIQNDYFLNRSSQASTRTREALLTLEREILPDLSASVTGTYRRYDKFDYGMTYYPTEHADQYPLYTGPTVIDPRTPPAGGWYVQAGTIPATFNIGGTFNDVTGLMEGGTTYSSGDAAGRPYYLPGPDWPTTSTNYVLYRKADAYKTYMGVDFVLNKRLSNKWFANASFTWQDMKNYWGSDFFDPTNRWAFEGKPYGDWGGGASGKLSVLMYTRWMFKVSGLYQLPLGFDISGTFNAREGWKVPHYFYIEDDNAPNYAAGSWALIYTQQYLKDSLPTFWNVTLRLEKKINISTGKLYLMADVFNLFNSAIVNRAYDAYSGDAYYNTLGQQYATWTNPTNRTLNEILNPRIWRFGARFEF